MVGAQQRDGLRPHALSPLLAAVALVAGAIAFTGSSGADVSAVGGGAFGASVDVALSGRTPTTSDPVPSVTPPSSGERVSESMPSLSVGDEDPSAPFGGRLLETGTLSVESQATTGPAGSSTSAASVADVAALGSFLTATEVASTCSSAEGDSMASTTLTDASLVGNETEAAALPGDPGPNTVIDTTMPGSGDVVTVILNEQEVVDGSIVVNAVRIMVDGPSAVGEVVLAQSRCATVATAPSPSAPTEPSVVAVTEPAEEPVTQVASLPSEDPSGGTLALPAAGPTTSPARVRTSPAENAQPNTTGTVVTGPVGPAEILAASLPGAGPGPFAAQVGAVSGIAFGYHATVSLFDQPQPAVGPAPQVTLPSAGGDEAGSAPSADVRFGPATVFTSGPLEVTTRGTTGPTGSVTSTAKIQNVNTSGDEVFTAADVSSTCTATGDDATGSTTITGGTIRTHAQAEDHPEGVVDIPTNPSPGHTVEGHLHIGASQDNFRYVFNEQIENADGSITVNAAHMYLLGPTAEGELIIGQSRCGVNPTGGTSDTGGRSGTGGAGATGDTSGTGAGSGSSRGGLADTGGEIPTMLAVALVLAAFTTRRWARPRPAAGADARP